MTRLKGASEGPVLSMDQAFEVLSNPRRRYILYCLHSRSEPIPLRQLADEVAAWEESRSVEELTSQQSKRAYVSLYQTHIPKLDDIGIVRFDRDSGVIELTEMSEEIERYLPAREEGVAWHSFYLGLAVASVIVFAAVLADVGALSVVQPTTVSLTAIGLFSLTSIFQYYQSVTESDPFAHLVAEPTSNPEAADATLQ